MRSIKEHFKQENELREQKEASVQVSVEDDEDFKKIETLNDAWNAEIAKLREVRVKKEKEKREVYILSRLDAKKEREEKLRQHANELVRKEMVGIQYARKSITITVLMTMTNIFLIHRMHARHTFIRKNLMRPLNMLLHIQLISIMLSMQREIFMRDEHQTRMKHQKIKNCSVNRENEPYAHDRNRIKIDTNGKCRKCI